MNKKNTTFLLLGTNVGSKELNLKKCISEVEKSIGVLLKKSSIYETEPWGNTNQDFFLNQAIKVITELSPNKLLEETLKIEKKLGRVRNSEKWTERIIDIDILFYNDKIINEKDLKIPHPLLHERKFALEPLNEICSDFIHPLLKKEVKKILAECRDELNVFLK